MIWKWKGKMPKWLAGAAFLVCAMVLAAILASEVTPRRTHLWLEASINSGEMTLYEGYMYGGALTLAARLPEWDSGWRPILEIHYTGTAEAELFLDGESMGRLEAWDGKTLGGAFFTLPQDCAGKTVTLETTKAAGEQLPFLYVTDSGIMEETGRAFSAQSTLPAAVFAVVSLLALGLFFYGLAEGERAWPVLLLGFAALGQMLYFHAQSRIGGSLPPKFYGLGLHLSKALLFAFPPVFFAVVYEKMPEAVPAFRGSSGTGLFCGCRLPDSGPGFLHGWRPDRGGALFHRGGAYSMRHIGISE